MSLSQSETSDRQGTDDAAIAHRPREVRTRWGGGARVLAAVVGIVLGVEFLRLAQPVLVPLVGGIFLAVLARPMHVRIRDLLPRRVRWLGLVVTMLAMIAGVGAFGGALALAGRAVATEYQGRRPQIEAQIERVRAWAARSGVPLPGPLGAGTSSGADRQTERGPEGTVGRPPVRGGDSSAAAAPASDVATRAFRTVAAGLAGLGLALAFAALGLAEAGELRRRIAHLGRGGGSGRALSVIDEAAPAFRRYVWVKSLTSAITGIATWLASLAFGLPLAWVWGFLAFLLEYVPTVGSLLAVIPPTLMALADGGPARGVAVLLVVGALQVVLGNVVDPRLEGRLMAVSPFGVLLSIVFWGWLWGAVGALLAVPLTVGIVIACRHIPGAQGFATVVAGDGVRNRE